MASSRSPVAQILAEQERELRTVLKRAAAAAAKEIRNLEGRTNVGSIVKKEQQLVALRALHDRLATLWTDIGHTVTASRHDAVARAIEVMVDYSKVLQAADLSAALIDHFKAGEIARAEANIDAIVFRVTGGRIPLSRQVYRSRALTTGQVDRIVDSAIARGVSWRELAADVMRFIDPDVRGGVSYAAQRLGRTEVANAFHGTSISYAQANPFVLAMRWNLSGSHVNTDECDTIAEGGYYQGQPGLYAVTSVPDLPHPQCLCFVTPETQDVAAFNAALANGDYDSFAA